jgi:hypothetical protein
MTLDHALRSQEVLNFLSKLNDVAVLPEPLRTLGPKTEALKTQTKACLALTMLVLLFVAFLSTDSTRVAARLSADGAFGLGGAGFL